METKCWILDKISPLYIIGGFFGQFVILVNSSTAFIISLVISLIVGIYGCTFGSRAWEEGIAPSEFWRKSNTDLVGTKWKSIKHWGSNFFFLSMSLFTIGFLVYMYINK